MVLKSKEHGERSICNLHDGLHLAKNTQKECCPSDVGRIRET
jgi:hypothetical protein